MIRHVLVWRNHVSFLWSCHWKQYRLYLSIIEGLLFNHFHHFEQNESRLYYEHYLLPDPLNLLHNLWLNMHWVGLGMLVWLLKTSYDFSLYFCCSCTSNAYYQMQSSAYWVSLVHLLALTRAFFWASVNVRQCGGFHNDRLNSRPLVRHFLMKLSGYVQGIMSDATIW